MTHIITSCGNVISMEHTASAVFVAFWPVFPFKGRIFYGLVKTVINHIVFTYFSTKYNYNLFKI